MLAGLQRLGPWLFGLFLIAQVGGVLLLVYVHAVHDYGHHDVIAASVDVGTSITPVASGTLSNPDQGDRGVAVDHDQCCALLHGLVGTLPVGSYQTLMAAASEVFEGEPVTSTSGHPARIDRPPRA